MNNIEDLQSAKEELFKMLSSFDRMILEEWLKGMSYDYISHKFSCRIQQVTDALLRVRRKAFKLKNNLLSN